MPITVGMKFVAASRQSRGRVAIAPRNDAPRLGEFVHLADGRVADFVQCLRKIAGICVGTPFDYDVVIQWFGARDSGETMPTSLESKETSR